MIIRKLKHCLWFFIFALLSVGSIEVIAQPEGCEDVKPLVDISKRDACTETVKFENRVKITVEDERRKIRSNSIPTYKVGLFGKMRNHLNPNPIAPIEKTYYLPAHPKKAKRETPLLSVINGPMYQFGILLNGVLLDPEAAEPWPHRGFYNTVPRNWEWNLDAMNVNLGLDCNNGHVQPNGKYHHHGPPTLYLKQIGADKSKMVLLGYAADGFPIYNHYGYEVADDSKSKIVKLAASYRLKSGERPGNGKTAPCGKYSGIYTNDFEYVEGLGHLDDCNGRTGVTPEYPGGTYYYVITDTYPYIGRCLKGTPSTEFSIRGR